MRNSKYPSILLFTFLSLLATIYLSSPLQPELFVKESGMIVILLVAAGIILYGLSRRVKGAYAATSVLFATLLFNFVYLYLEGSREKVYTFSHYFVLLIAVAISIFGFFFSLERIGSFDREKKARRELSKIAAQLRELRSKSEVIAKELKSLEEVQPKVIIEKESKKSRKTAGTRTKKKSNVKSNSAAKKNNKKNSPGRRTKSTTAKKRTKKQ